jgi:hypothetical protein
VVHETFDFKVLSTDHFDLYYYLREERAVRDAAPMLERRYHAYAQLPGVDFAEPQPVVLYANHPDFQQSNVIGGRIPQGTGGFTESLANPIVLPLTGLYADTEHVLAHELVYAFIFNMGGSTFKNASSNLPLWFSEGLAEYLSLGARDPHTAMWMRDAVLHDSLPGAGQLFRRPDRYSRYRYGHALWSYIGGVWGREIAGRLLRAALRRGWRGAVENVLGMEAKELVAKWRMATTIAARPILEGRQRPEELGQKILGDPGAYNLSPALSPDGRILAFLSRRGPFTMDLYLADADSGEVVGKLASSAGDRHYEALRFVESAGSWSPDGRSLALCASRGGLTDLYLYDLESGELRRLTDDPYAELHPAWSPDGGKLAFSTDRGPRTDFERLRFGALKIGLLELSSGRIELFSVEEGVRHLNPQFSPDGKELYLLADPQGVPDLFRHSFREGDFTRLSRVATGIAGLNATSPALSVAAGSGEIACTVLENGGYGIYRLKAEAVRALEEPGGRRRADLLPPRYPGRLVSVPEARAPELKPMVSEYTPSLGPVEVGQLAVGVSVGGSGAGVYGSFAGYFADVLGNHNLFSVVQISGSWKDSGAQLTYWNLRRRLNLRMEAAHIPQISSTIESQEEVDGTLTSTLIQRRQFIDRLDLLFRYPLSPSRRLELSTGYTHVGYDSEAEVVKTRDGLVVERTTREVDTPPPLHLSQSVLAYVADYSFLGFTAPLRGRRLRLEVEPTVGSLQFLSVGADLRGYLFIADTFSLALRAFHYGRYFGDAESPRLAPLGLGYERWVRGYSPVSFTSAECDESGCAAFDRLFDSRLAVANAELRLPLLGSGELGLVDFPYIPLSLLVFFDAGVAWTSDEPPVLRWATDSQERIPVFSTGAGMRINLGGVLVLQISYAYPFQRPNRRAHFGLAVTPGW